MEQICPRCKYIGYGKHSYIPGSILRGGLLIGMGLILFATSIFDGIENELMKSVTTSATAGLFTILGVVMFTNFFKLGTKCPKCEQENMYLIDDVKSQSLMTNNNITLEDSATDICNDCYHKGIRKPPPSLMGSYVLLFFGFLSVVLIFVFHIMYKNLFSDFLALIAAVIMLYAGFYGLTANNINKKTKCPSCKKKTFIPIASKQAQSLIKQDQTKAPTT